MLYIFQLKAMTIAIVLSALVSYTINPRLSYSTRNEM